MSTVGADNWADATELPYNSISDPTPTAGLTTEVDEPDDYGIGSNLRSAWWKFTAPATEQVGLDLFSSVITGDIDNTDPIIEIWTGTDLASLTYVADEDDNDRPDDPDTGDNPYGAWLTEMNFDATEGVTYYIQVFLWDYSDDMEYRLRMGKRLITYSDWVQPDDYETDWAGSIFGATNAGRQISSSGNLTAGTVDSGMNALLQAGLADTSSVTSIDPDFVDDGILGLFDAFCNHDSPYNWTLDIFVRALFFQSDFASMYAPNHIDYPYDATSYELEYGGTSGTGLGTVLHAYLQGAWGDFDPRTGDSGITPEISGTLGLRIVDWSGQNSTVTNDPSMWDLSDSTVIDDAVYDNTAGPEGNPLWTIDDFDMAPYLSVDAYYLMLTGHPGTLDTTWPFSETFKFTLQDRVRLISPTAIHYVIHPPAYRFVYWDIDAEDVPPTGTDGWHVTGKKRHRIPS